MTKKEKTLVNKTYEYIINIMLSLMAIAAIGWLLVILIKGFLRSLGVM